MRHLTSTQTLSIHSVAKRRVLAAARALTLGLLVWLVATPAGAAVLAAKGDILSLSDPPASVVLNVTESDDGVIFLRERRNVALTSDLDVDIVETGRVNGDLPISPGVIPAGTRVDSYFLHCDPATRRSRWQGTVTFDREVLGIVVRPRTLIDTNDTLGAPGTVYDPTSAMELQAEDIVELHSDRHSVSIDWYTTIGIDQIRVITRGTPSFNYQASFLHEVPFLESSAATSLDHPFANDQPDALLFPTQLSSLYTINYDGMIRSPIAVHKDGSDPHWSVRATDGYNLHAGATLAVLMADPSSDAFVHTATASNTGYNYTVLDHPRLNGNPDARILVAARDGAISAPDEYLGVWYTWEGRWSIFLEDKNATLPVGATFNVLVLPDDGTSFVHTVTEANLSDLPGHFPWSVIDDPRLNGKNLILPQVVQLWNPNGGLGVYNDHPVVLSYNSPSERWHLENTDRSDIPVGSSFIIYVPPTPSFAFEHRATPENSSGHVSFAAHELLDGSAAPILLETPNLSPRQGVGVPNPRATGLYLERFFDPATWGIFNQDTSRAYPDGAVSNLFQPPMDLRTFVHEATPENSVGNWTNLYHPGLHNQAGSIVFVTQQWVAGEELTVGVYNDHNIGVWWNESEGAWAVFNQDGQRMPVGATFNVFVAKSALENPAGYLHYDTAPVDPRDVAFVHVATAGTLDGDRTVIDHRWLNGNPDLQLIVTQNWNPGGAPGVYNDHPIAVEYDPASSHWAVVNQDGAAMPENAAFNVLPVGIRATPEIVIKPPKRRACGLGAEGALAVMLIAELKRRLRRKARG